MSSRSRRSRRLPPPAGVRRLVLAPLVALAALAAAVPGAPGAAAHPAAPAAPAPEARKARPPRTAPAVRTPPVVADDSTGMAQSLIRDLRALYGGDDAWGRMDGFRYYVTYTIPGPEGAPVRTWTESHFMWMHGAPRARIDVAEDSTIVIVSGDTTWVRRAGAWMTDSTVVAAARAQALDALWSWHLPRNLVDPRIRARQVAPPVKGEPFTTRFHFDRPGLERPPGTILAITFAPPGYAMRRLHWYDPRARAWYLLELADDRQRYGFTWAERRTLRASDEGGEPGPVLWTAVVQDFQIEGALPAVVLTPPGRGAGVVTPPAAAAVVPVPAAADSAARR